MTSETKTPDTGLDDLLNRHFRRQGRSQGLDQAGQGRCERAGLRPGVPPGELLRLQRRGGDRGRPAHGQESPGRELRPARRSREGEVHDPGAGQPQGHRQGDGDAQREAGRVRGAARQPGRQGRSKSTAAIVKKFEKLLVGGIWCIVTLEYFFEEDQKGSPFVAAGLEADPDAEHGHGGIVPGAAGLHRGAVDRRAAALDRHGADELHRAGEVAPAGPHDSAGREQLQPLRAWPEGHGQEPHLQGDQPEQHPGLRWADHGRQPVLQHGPASGRAGRPVGRGGLR